jgi:hypothetical protein
MSRDGRRGGCGVAIALADSRFDRMRLPRFWVPLGAGSPRAGLRVASGATRNDKGGPTGRIRHFLDSSGHTLAETLVAMSLFVGVLIPLLAAIGNLMFDDRAERLQEALHLAQSEISLAEGSKENLAERTEAGHGLSLERHVSSQGTLAQIDVIVRDTKKANRIVVHLSKTILVKSVQKAG